VVVSASYLCQEPYACVLLQHLTHVYAHAHRKGNAVSVTRRRHVGLAFGKEVVHKYDAMLAKKLHSLVSSVIQESAQTDSTAAMECGQRSSKVAVISFTEDLRLNAQRSGAPPQSVDGSISRVNLWRNEGVCLQQVRVPVCPVCPG
jgi:hypothetical protein